MIRNERQYLVTKAQAERFAKALDELQQRPPGKRHPLLRKVEEDALRSQLADLSAELTEYEELRSGRQPPSAAASFDDLPRVLIQARIAAGLSQKDLAQRLGLKEQQIQRYEATDYATAKLSRLRAVMRALGVEVRMESKLAVAEGSGGPSSGTCDGAGAG
jgi:ribosome-binding protein aMBF1 (putative translation factor)